MILPAMAPLAGLQLLFVVWLGRLCSMPQGLPAWSRFPALLVEQSGCGSCLLQTRRCRVGACFKLAAELACELLVALHEASVAPSKLGD